MYLSLGVLRYTLKSPIHIQDLFSENETKPPGSPMEHPNHGNNGHHEIFLEMEKSGASKPEEPSGVTNDTAHQKAKENGVSLTWKDLWVTVPDKKKGRRPILQGLNGYVQPGEVLAVMGPSGSGKSTLLDALAGRLESNTRQTGEILINGRKQALAFGTSAYVTQDDALMTTLTVREAIYYSAQLQLPDSMTRSEKKQRADSTIKEMGLQDAMDTRIGGWNGKGISGGQKRRVSICIELLTRPKLLFLDEPTSGLDSAASYHVISRIVELVRLHRRTVIASIHQPNSEVFELFHNLCLLSGGKTVYFGSTSAANKFFERCGFPCPQMKNPSDHYLRTINQDFEVDTGIERGLYGRSSTTDAIEILVQSYKSSDDHKQLQESVTMIHQQGGGSANKLRRASFTNQCVVLTQRSLVNMYRDIGYYWLRFAIYLALASCMGTIFYHLGTGYGTIQARSSFLFFVLTFFTFMAIGGFPSFVEDLKVSIRERLNGHYGVAPYLVANTLSSAPYLLLISLVPVYIAYYLAGLQRGIEHFITFVLILFACMLLVESMMMIIAVLVPNYLMGIMVGAGVQGLMAISGGFFRLPKDLPKPIWRYPMYYPSFHNYANEGFFKNEFIGLVFPNQQQNGPSMLTGEYILKNIFQVETYYSKWVDVAIFFGMVVVYRLIFLGIVTMSQKLRLATRDFLSSFRENSIEDENKLLKM